MEYLHKCAFILSLSTFQRAIQKGNFVTWPSIKHINFKKLIKQLVPTAKGCLDQERANLQSTKIVTNKKTIEDLEPTDRNATKTFQNTAILYPFNPKETTYSDQTGRIPYQSSRGNEYLMIMYDHDANAILVEALKNRQAKSISDAWENLHRRLTMHGHITKNILDNECSAELKATLKIIKSSMNLLRQTFIAAMQQKEQWEHLKTTSWLVLQLVTKIFWLRNGIVC